MRKYLFAVLAALTAGVALAFTPVAYTNSYVKDGVTYSQRGGLGTSNYVAVAVNALENNYTALTNNANFKAAVETVSPPAALPDKWALANITNATGGAVTADDVGAYEKIGPIEMWTYPDSNGIEVFNTNFPDSHISLINDGGTASLWIYGTTQTMTDDDELFLFPLQITANGSNMKFPKDHDGTFALTRDIPQKWALANVTNATGGSVTADNVGALPATKYSSEYHISYPLFHYEKLYAGNRYTTGLNYGLNISKHPNNDNTKYETINFWNDRISQSYYDLSDQSNPVVRNWDNLFPTNAGMIARMDDVPTNVSSLNNDAGYITNETQFVTWKDGGTDWSLIAGRGITQAGQNATMYGASTKAGLQGTAIGYGAQALGTLAVSIGRDAKTSGMTPVAVGASSEAKSSGGYDVAVGYGARAKGGWSTAIGANSCITNFMAAAIGDTCSHGDYTFNIATPEIDGIWLGGWHGTNLTTKLNEKYVQHEHLTNTVNAVKAEFYDEPLQVNWTVRMVNGEMKLYATTNVNMSTL